MILEYFINLIKGKSFIHFENDMGILLNKIIFHFVIDTNFLSLVLSSINESRQIHLNCDSCFTSTVTVTLPQL